MASIAEPLIPRRMTVEGLKAQSEMVIDSLDRLITAWEGRNEFVVVEDVHLSLNFVIRLTKKHPSIILFMIYIYMNSPVTLFRKIEGRPVLQNLGKKGVWIKLPLELAYLVAPAVKEGFWYHHAEKDYLMLVNWLPETENTLPSNASHRMGIAAFVINENKEVLVVKERHGSFKGMGWKFPSGTINEGEDICDGAVREVKEETAIDSEFVEILAFRQSHKSFFEKSDVFFLCILKPLSFEIKKQDSEIEEAKWMPFEEYANQELVKKSELMASITEICSEKENGNYVGFSTVPITSKSSGKKSFLYLNRGSR